MDVASSGMQDFRRLEVWKSAKALAVDVRCATRSFPRAGYRTLQTQMIAAAESIIFNIVEGCGSSTEREFARFLEIAIKSAFELEAQVDLAKDYRILGRDGGDRLAESVVSLRRRLCALRKKVKERADKQSR
jgi:four helix bundle protein